MTNTEWFLLRCTAAYATLVHLEPETAWSGILVAAIVTVAFEIARGIGHAWEFKNND